MTDFVLIFLYFKFLCVLLIIILLIGIIYYFYKLHIISQWIEKWQNLWGIVPVYSLSAKNRKEWKKIEKLLEEPYESSWKLAVIKAEEVVKRTLNLIGYVGNDFKKILEKLKFRKYKNLEILYQLHDIREKIIRDKKFALSQNKAKEIVRIYKKFWEELLNTL